MTGSTPGGLEAVLEGFLGIGFNPEVAAIAELRFLLEGATRPPVLLGNALWVGLEREGGFDLVLTNPPFGRKGKVDNQELLARYDLGHAWKRIQGGRGKGLTRPSRASPRRCFFWSWL